MKAYVSAADFRAITPSARGSSGLRVLVESARASRARARALPIVCFIPGLDKLRVNRPRAIAAKRDMASTLASRNDARQNASRGRKKTLALPQAARRVMDQFQSDSLAPPTQRIRKTAARRKRCPCRQPLIRIYHLWLVQFMHLAALIAARCFERAVSKVIVRIAPDPTRGIHADPNSTAKSTSIGSSIWSQ